MPTRGEKVVSELITAHGARGVLVDVMADAATAAELRAASRDWPSWDLAPRQVCDLELLLSGGFSPLSGFMGGNDYRSVVDTMRLADGTLWPIPITLDLPEAVARGLTPGGRLALRDHEGVMLAALTVDDVWQPDRGHEAEAVFGTRNAAHPGVRYLLEQSHDFYVGGTLTGLTLPLHYDYRALRHTPAQLRDELARCGWSRVVAFQTRNPMHRAHQELTLRAAREVDAKLLVHPVVGMTKPGDVDHYTRVRCYRALMPSYPEDMALLSLLPLAMRMAGPREAVWHAIIRKNYGCTHLVVGRDHAGPGQAPDGKPFYGPYDAQQLLEQHESELGIAMVPFKQLVYVPSLDRYLAEEEVPAGTETVSISGTEQRRRLQLGLELPSWFTFPTVERELRRASPPRQRQGLTVFFTGLSGSGKSTIANVLLVKLLERGDRQVTMLDGDLVRRHLSSELGFSKEHRDLNIRRIGFVASEITRNGGIALCAPIAPYERTRADVRAMIEPVGGFVLVHVATPIEVCEARDRKGLYAKARAGIVKEFTGVSDPYEAPARAEIVIDTSDLTPEEAADTILGYLAREGYLVGEAEA